MAAGDEGDCPAAGKVLARSLDEGSPDAYGPDTQPDDRGPEILPPPLSCAAGSSVIEQGLWIGTGSGAEQSWFKGWTAFYWAWWIAWSPFVGLFIARISRGRTVREFVLGVLGAPALACFIALTIFGTSALEMQTSGQLDLVKAVGESVPSSLFVFLSEFPMGTLLSVYALLCVVIFFVTSSDSASLVIDILTSGGDLEPPSGNAFSGPSPRASSLLFCSWPAACRRSKWPPSSPHSPSRW
ncbi:MAG: hypothetical protein ACI9OJ_000389 [Myxococcota bacterium]